MTSITAQLQSEDRYPHRKMLLEFDVENDNYLEFIQDLRSTAKSPFKTSHGCPVLPLKDEVEGQNIDVNLQVQGLDKGTLIIRRFDLLLMSYQKPGCSVLDLSSFNLYDNSRLIDLEKVPLLLRPSTLVEAINFLADSKIDLTELKEKDEVISSLLVLRILICEAAKFHTLSSVFDNVFKSVCEVPLHPWMLKLITHWEDLSKELLLSYIYSGASYSSPFEVPDTEDCNLYLPTESKWHLIERRVIGVTCEDVSRCIGILNGTIHPYDHKELNLCIQGKSLAQIYAVLVYIDGCRSGCIYGKIEVRDMKLTHHYILYDRDPTDCEVVESYDTIALQGPRGFIDVKDECVMELDLKDRNSCFQINKKQVALFRTGNYFLQNNDSMLDRLHSVLVRGDNGYAVVFFGMYRSAVLATIEATLLPKSDPGNVAGTTVCVCGSIVAQSDTIEFSIEHKKYCKTKVFDEVVGKIVEFGVDMPLSTSKVAFHTNCTVTIEASLKNSEGDPLVTGSLHLNPQEAGVFEGCIGQPDDLYSIQLKLSWSMPK